MNHLRFLAGTLLGNSGKTVTPRPSLSPRSWFPVNRLELAPQAWFPVNGSDTGQARLELAPQASSGRRHGFVPFALLAAMLAATVLPAQTDSKRTPEQVKASYAAHKSDFDYLLGDWEFTSVSRQWGKFGGRWSAVRLETGQILDEYRVVGDNGETFYATSTIRAYNAPADRWELIGMDGGGGGLQDFGTAQRVNSEMHIEQKFGVAGGKPITLRIKYYNIEPNRFSWSADRSSDDGQTWVKDFQTIEAHRIGPPRDLGPLAPAKKQ